MNVVGRCEDGRNQIVVLYLVSAEHFPQQCVYARQHLFSLRVFFDGGCASHGSEGLHCPAMLPVGSALIGADCRLRARTRFPVWSIRASSRATDPDPGVARFGFGPGVLQGALQPRTYGELVGYDLRV